MQYKKIYGFFMTSDQKLLLKYNLKSKNYRKCLYIQ